MIACVTLFVTPDLNVPAKVHVAQADGRATTTAVLAAWPVSASMQLIGDPVEQANWIDQFCLELQSCSEALRIRAYATQAVSQP